jgi:hypothetical protein
MLEMSGETLRRIEDAVARLVSGAYGYYSARLRDFSECVQDGVSTWNVLKCPAANS